MAHTVVHHLFIAGKAVINGLALLVLWIIVFLSGLFFWSQFPSPVNFLLGIPLILLGLTMGLAALYEMIVGIVFWRWGRTHCPFCKVLDKTPDLR